MVIVKLLLCYYHTVEILMQWIWYRCHGTNSPLHLASLNGIVKLLLCSYHMVEILMQWIWYRCHGTNSPLHLASLNGIVKLLLCSYHMVEILMQRIPPTVQMPHGKTCHGHLYIWHLGMVIVKLLVPFIITWWKY